MCKSIISDHSSFPTFHPSSLHSEPVGRTSQEMTCQLYIILDSSVNHKAIIKTSGNNLSVMPHHRTAQAQVRFDVAKSNMAAVDPRWLPPARQMYHPASAELLKSKLDVKMHQNVKIVEKYMRKKRYIYIYIQRIYDVYNII